VSRARRDAGRRGDVVKVDVGLRVALGALVLTAFASGCGTHRSVLDEGVRFGVAGRVHRIGPSEAVSAVAHARADWEHELRTRAQRDPGASFSNLPASVLRRRLAEFARRYDFDVVSVQLLRPRRVAPSIVVRTKHYAALARATRLILKQLDPKLRTNDDRTGWRYEGFFFEAVDEDGIPFLAVFNVWRGSGGGGGQWARSDALFPFAHG